MSDAEVPDQSPTAKLAMGLHVLLQGRDETVTTAESLTGGLLASMLTDAPGASLSYVGGVVSYATELKVRLLDVPQAVVAEHGVVSAECAAAMARGARELTGATYALSTTGVAGPGEQEGKPAGSVFIGVATPHGVRTESLTLDGDRHAIRVATCAAALSMLSDVLRTVDTPGGDVDETSLR